MTGPNKRRIADAPVLLVHLDEASRRPLHRQVYDGLREAILGGRLAAGARLPSTRALASDLGIARNTVGLAFDQLRSEGYIVGRRGGGTRVRSATPDLLLQAEPVVRRARVTATGTPARVAERKPPPELSRRGARLAEFSARTAERGALAPRPFRLGVPALDAFPAALWARLTARRWRRGGVPLGDGEPAGSAGLRATIAEYAANARGVRCTPRQVMIVSGTQHALDLVARVLIDPGDAVCIEDPGYLDGRAPLIDAGARLVAVPVDDEGLDVLAAERAAPDARAVLVTPSHQFPLGSVMSAPRRIALLAWARRAKVWIIEDDYDSEFRYTGRPLPCLQGLDAEHRDGGDSRVIYVGTFSKTLAPGLRLGYLILPESLVDAFRDVRSALDRHAPTIEQGVLADFIAGGHYARHLRRVRTLYAERQEALLAAAESELGGLLTFSPDAAGLHLVGRLPAGLRDTDAVIAGEREGVETTALSRYCLEPSLLADGALLLSYAGFDERAIREGVVALRRGLEAATRDAR